MNRRLFLLAGLVLSGCASTQVSSYRLAAVPGPAQPFAPGVIEVRNIGIPGYLDQNGIVKTSTAYEFDTYANQLWAEPLAAMLQAVMVEDLAQLLPSATVIASNGVIDAPPRILIEINVQKFDPDPSGSLVLLAQVAIKDGSTHALLHAQTLHLTTVPSPGITGIVAAMSQLWAQASAQIAASL